MLAQHEISATPGALIRGMLDAATQAAGELCACTNPSRNQASMLCLLIGALRKGVHRMLAKRYL